MIAQAYFGTKKEPLYIRIFKDRNSSMVAELPLKEATEESANKSLKAINLNRKGKWLVTSWGREATVYFKK